MTRSLFLISLFSLSRSLLAELPASMEVVKSDPAGFLSRFHGLNSAEQVQTLEEMGRWEMAASYPGGESAGPMRRLEYLQVPYSALLSTDSAVRGAALNILNFSHVKNLPPAEHGQLKREVTAAIQRTDAPPTYITYFFLMHHFNKPVGDEELIQNAWEIPETLSLSDQVRQARTLADVIALNALSTPMEKHLFRVRLYQMLGDKDPVVAKIAKVELDASLNGTVTIPGPILTALVEALQGLHRGQIETRTVILETIKQKLRSRFPVQPAEMDEARVGLALYLESEMQLDRFHGVLRLEAAQVARNILLTDDSLTGTLAKLAAEIETSPKLWEVALSTLKSTLLGAQGARLNILKSMPYDSWAGAEALSTIVEKEFVKAPRYAEVFLTLVRTRQQFAKTDCAPNECEMKSKVLAALDAAVASYNSSRGLRNEVREPLAPDHAQRVLQQLGSLFSEAEDESTKSSIAVQLAKLGDNRETVLALAQKGLKRGGAEDEADETEDGAGKGGKSNGNSDSKLQKQLALLELLDPVTAAKSDEDFQAAMEAAEQLARIYHSTVIGSHRYLTVYVKLVKLLAKYNEKLSLDIGEARMNRTRKLEEYLYPMILRAGINVPRMILSYPKKPEFHTERTREIAAARRMLGQYFEGQPRVAVPAILGLRFMSGTPQGLTNLEHVVRTQEDVLVRQAVLTVLVRYTKRGSVKGEAKRLINQLGPQFDGLTAYERTEPEEAEGVRSAADNDGEFLEEVSATAPVSIPTPGADRLPELMAVFNQKVSDIRAVQAGDLILRSARNTPLCLDLTNIALEVLQDTKRGLPQRRQAAEMVLLSLSNYMNGDNVVPSTPGFPRLAALLRPGAERPSDPVLELAYSSLFELLFVRSQTSQAVMTWFNEACVNEILGHAK